MTDPSPRIYTDEEVSRILKRATELHRAEAEAAPYGLSLAELQQVAADVGVDPRYIARAAGELERKGEGRFYLLGGPTSIELERVVAGTVSDAQWEEMVTEISRTFRAVGWTETRGPTHEWTYRSRREQIQVTVTQGEGQTRLRVFSQFTRTAVLAYAPLMAVSFILAFNIPLALNLSPLLWGSLLVSILAAVFLLARFSYAAVVRRKESRSEHVLEALSARVEPSQGQTGGEASRAESQSPLPGDVRLDAEVARQDEPRQGRQRGRIPS